MARPSVIHELGVAHVALEVVAVAFLASPRASFSGQSLYVDGGKSLPA